MRELNLRRERACVVLVDAQERLAAAMPPDALARMRKYAAALLGGAKVLGIPVLATEQYPKGLGPTLSDLKAALPKPALAKSSFSCAGNEPFARALKETGRDQVILAGMETHVCVFLTARDLLAAGRTVHVCADAVCSRTEENRQLGLSLCREAGATITSAETALFDLLGQAGTDEFKAISALVK
jgi:nicotinamidase-related amidase